MEFLKHWILNQFWLNLFYCTWAVTLWQWRFLFTHLNLPLNLVAIKWDQVLTWQTFAEAIFPQSLKKPILFFTISQSRLGSVPRNLLQLLYWPTGSPTIAALCSMDILILAKGGEKITLICLAMVVWTELMPLSRMSAWFGEHHSRWNTWNWEPVGGGFRCAADRPARLLSEGKKNTNKRTQKLCERPKQQHEKWDL